MKSNVKQSNVQKVRQVFVHHRCLRGLFHCKWVSSEHIEILQHPEGSAEELRPGMPRLSCRSNHIQSAALIKQAYQQHVQQGAFHACAKEILRKSWGWSPQKGDNAMRLASGGNLRAFWGF